MEGKKQIIINSGLIIISIIMVIVILKQSKTIEDLTGRVNNVTTYSVDTDTMRDEISEAISEKNSNVYNVDYSIKKYDGKKRLAYVTAKFSLKKYNTDNDIIVFYQDGDEVKNVKATDKNGVFEAKLVLSIDNSEPYEISYKMGTKKVEGNSLFEIDPSQEISERISFTNMITTSAYKSALKQTEMEMELYVSNYFGDDDKLKFKSCDLVIYPGNEKVQRIDLMKDLIIDNNSQCMNNEPFNLNVKVDGDVTEGIGIKIELVAVDGYGIEHKIDSETE